MPSYRYRNIATGTVATYSQPMERLDRSDRWEPVGDDPGPPPPPFVSERDPEPDADES